MSIELRLKKNSGFQISLHFNARDVNIKILSEYRPTVNWELKNQVEIIEALAQLDHNHSLGFKIIARPPTKLFYVEPKESYTSSQFAFDTEYEAQLYIVIHNILNPKQTKETCETIKWYYEKRQLKEALAFIDGLCTAELEELKSNQALIERVNTMKERITDVETRNTILEQRLFNLENKRKYTSNEDTHKKTGTFIVKTRDIDNGDAVHRHVIHVIFDTEAEVDNYREKIPEWVAKHHPNQELNYIEYHHGGYELDFRLKCEASQFKKCSGNIKKITIEANECKSEAVLCEVHAERLA